MTGQNKKRRRIDAVLIGGLLLAMLAAPLAGFGQRCGQVREEVLRLHILANSDSEADQAVKLKVRDAVLEATGELFAGADGLAEARGAAEDSLALIEATARQVLAENGCPGMPVKAEVSRSRFGTREYGETVLPAGEYAAVRITLGEGAGQNWWCVMFPPLCVPAAAWAEEGEPGEAARDIAALNEEPHYRLAFASVELLEELLAE